MLIEVTDGAWNQAKLGLRFGGLRLYSFVYLHCTFPQSGYNCL